VDCRSVEHSWGGLDGPLCAQTAEVWGSWPRPEIGGSRETPVPPDARFRGCPTCRRPEPSSAPSVLGLSDEVVESNTSRVRKGEGGTPLGIGERRRKAQVCQTGWLNRRGFERGRVSSTRGDTPSRCKVWGGFLPGTGGVEVLHDGRPRPRPGAVAVPHQTPPLPWAWGRPWPAHLEPGVGGGKYLAALTGSRGEGARVVHGTPLGARRPELLLGHDSGDGRCPRTSSGVVSHSSCFGSRRP